ncbi:molybdenum cofactor biosynthesis protein MoaE [Marinivivus vitaminiproducens]|uniref:molybdenum cofactor biosynthesis protein MoaE n=1 Tax=Marinivivus vitaminiproducens TaxID=3035935 RepID=UPI0027988A6C|nr:molybdenum cofactor biosynthesis protein MoaE [Geminicoccaceae bacterium SCSIO 64248]
MIVRVQAETFDAGREMAALAEGRHDIGALASFTGLVRDRPDGNRLIALTLEHYPGMTERQLEAIAAEAERRWPLQACLIVHRIGRMLPGEPIVLVATASAHRAAALDACAFLMDWLKTQAPFWKLEEVEGEEPVWVEARAADDRAADRWR